jgi:hypothetical protein
MKHRAPRPTADAGNRVARVCNPWWHGFITHDPELSANSKPLLAILPLALVLAGCSDEMATTGGPAAQTAGPKVVVTEPTFAPSTKHLTLPGIDGDVTLGESRMDALKPYPKPEAASLLTSLPPALRGLAGFSAESWQSGTEGFGLVLYSDRVCLAEHQKEKATEADLLALIAALKAKNDPDATTTGANPKTISGTFVRYWFWQSGNERLMVSAFQNPTDSTLSITTALGVSGDPANVKDVGVMDTLGMSLEKAREDADRADTSLEDFFHKTGRPTPPTSSPSSTPPPNVN